MSGKKYLDNTLRLKLRCLNAEAERDEARNLARWLWAACQELRRQRDGACRRSWREGMWDAAHICHRPGYYGIREQIMQAMRKSYDD